MKHRWLLRATVGFLTLGIRYQMRLGQPGDVNLTVRPLAEKEGLGLQGVHTGPVLVVYSYREIAAGLHGVWTPSPSSRLGYSKT